MKALDYFTGNLNNYLRELQELTEIETPTGHLDNLGVAADYLKQHFEKHTRLRRQDLPDHGPLLHAVREGSDTRILLLAHYDTVWPIGSWNTLWRVEGGRAYGPGVYDMKGGLLFILWLLRFLEATGSDHPHLEILLTPDEEIGSPGTRPYIEEAARGSDLALVLEPSNLDGHLKLARKGSGEYVISIHGRATHQGVEPEHGINAVVEAAHKVLQLLEFEDLEAGTTVGPNVIDGGTASNMVPDRAEIRVDVRAWTVAETERLDAAIRALEPSIEGAQIHIFGGWNRPPMEATQASLDFFEGARAVGKTVGLDIDWVPWGGSSDANIAASVGTPTVDGFGPIGGGAHRIDEFVVIDEIPRRMALLAEIVGSLTALTGD